MTIHPIRLFPLALLSAWALHAHASAAPGGGRAGNRGTDPTADTAAPEAPEAPAAAPVFYIQEYRVRGSASIPPLAVEEAVYPYLGRGRTESDVKKACAALEKAYHQAGYQAVK